MIKTFSEYREEQSDGIDYDELICMVQQLRAIYEGWADPITHIFEKEEYDYVYQWEWKP